MDGHAENAPDSLSDLASFLGDTPDAESPDEDMEHDESDDSTAEGDTEDEESDGQEESDDDESDDEEAEDTPAPERKLKVTVKGDDGTDQEIEVDESEVVKGYQRQADYTRKTQEIAQLREEAEYGLNLARALEEDPSKTLAILQMLHQDVDVAAAEDELLDPQEKRLRQVESFIEAQNQAELEAKVTRELDAYSAKFGLEPDEVLQHALDLNLGVEQLDLAVRSLMFEKSQIQAAVSEHEASEAAAEAAVGDAKAQAAFIAGGSATTPDATQTQIPTSGDPKEVAWAVWKRAGLV